MAELPELLCIVIVMYRVCKEDRIGTCDMPAGS